MAEINLTQAEADTLLPKLLLREIRVGDAESTFEL